MKLFHWLHGTNCDPWEDVLLRSDLPMARDCIADMHQRADAEAEQRGGRYATRQEYSEAWSTFRYCPNIDTAKALLKVAPSLSICFTASSPGGAYYERDPRLRATTVASLLFNLCWEAGPLLVKALASDERHLSPSLVNCAITELAAFALHTAERLAISRIGPSRKCEFMDALFQAIRPQLQAWEKLEMESENQEELALLRYVHDKLQVVYNSRASQFSRFPKWVPGKDESPAGTLVWEFSKALCLAQAPRPETLLNIVQIVCSFTIRMCDAFDMAKVFA